MHTLLLLAQTRLAVALAVMAGLFTSLIVLSVLGRIPIRYNVRNLVVRWRTTLLTALAFTLVIGLLTVMLAFIRGLTALTESSGKPNNLVILSEGATSESFSNLGFSDLGDLELQQGIARENGKPLASRETYMVINQPVPFPAPGRPRKRFLQLRGIDDPEISAKVHDLSLYPGGTWFSTAGVRELPRALGRSNLPVIEVVIGEGIARELAKDRHPDSEPEVRESLQVGDWFALADREWLIVGIMDTEGTVFGSEVWAKRAVIAPLFGKETYTSVVLQANDIQAAKAAAEFFNRDYSKAAIKAYTEPEYFAQLGETNQQFSGAITFVTIVMAIGGVLGVMNTMFAAIHQRTKDIGVLGLLGFSRWRIVVSFMLESLLIALVGGALGCALGCLAHGASATSILSAGGGGGKSVVLRLTVDWQILATGILLAIAMGFLGGLIPSISAVLKKPLEALR